MIRFLVFTDTHANVRAHKKVLEKVKKYDPEFILCLGDFSIFMHGAEEFFEFAKTLKKPIYLIHGNHEDEEEIEVLCDNTPNITFLHKKAIVHKNLLLMGYGGGGFSLTDPHFEKTGELFKDAIEKHPECKRILLLHQPPHKTMIDTIHATHTGSKTTKKFIQTHKVDMVYAGHIHENFQKMQTIRQTLYLNPGPYGKIISLDDE